VDSNKKKARIVLPKLSMMHRHFCGKLRTLGASNRRFHAGTNSLRKENGTPMKKETLSLDLQAGDYVVIRGRYGLCMIYLYSYSISFLFLLFFLSFYLSYSLSLSRAFSRSSPLALLLYASRFLFLIVAVALVEAFMAWSSSALVDRSGWPGQCAVILGVSIGALSALGYLIWCYSNFQISFFPGLLAVHLSCSRLH
jgi:hypothetical protein